MDEMRLHALLSHAVSAEPPAERPLGWIVADSRRVGGRIRRRRRTESAVASGASVAVVAVAVSFASGAFGHMRNQSPAGHSGRSRQMAYVVTLSGRPSWPGTGAVVPVNLATAKVGRPLQSGLVPPMIPMTDGNDIVAAPGGRTLYVSTSRGVILPISTATGKVGKAIRVAGVSYEADKLMVPPDGRVAYAISIGNSSITPIDLVTGRASRQLSVPRGSTGLLPLIAESRNGRTLLAAGLSNSASSEVTVVTSGRAQKPIKLGFSGVTCDAVSPDGTMGYLARRSVNGRYSVVPIDVATNTPLKAIQLRKQNYTGSCAMAVAPNGRTAYVLSGQYVAPIDLVTGRALKPIELPGVGFARHHFGGFEIAVDPNGRTAYAVGPWEVDPIDLASNKALPPIRYSGKFAGFCLSFSPNGRTVLVGAGGKRSGQLLLIHAATGKIFKSIGLAGVPIAIAATP